MEEHVNQDVQNVSVDWVILGRIVRVSIITAFATISIYGSFNTLLKTGTQHCVKSVRIWSFSGPYFPA